jgi:hypothetical protein
MSQALAVIKSRKEIEEKTKQTKREGMIETDRYIKERRGKQNKKVKREKKRQKKVDERHTHQSYLALPWRISVFLFRFFFLSFPWRRNHDPDLC